MINHLTLCLVFYAITSTFHYSLGGTGFFWDWISRLRLNDTTLQFHHFFWTTFTYLGPFFWHHPFLVTLIISESWTVWVWLIWSLYEVEMQDHLSSNYYFTEIFRGYWNFNLLLTNNLNKYHPHLFYFSTFSLMILLMRLTSRFYQKSNYFRLSEKQSLTHTHLLLIGVLNSFALFLGSWWAFQEGTWGGWWNWDPSEVLGLLILLTTLILSHRQWDYATFDSAYLKLKKWALAFLWIYLFTQLNFDLISHNFGNRFSFFFVNTLFYIDSLTLLTLTTLYLIVNKKNGTTSLVTYQSRAVLNRTHLWLASTLSLVWLLLIFTSFYPLVNYFLWQYFHLNFLNKSETYSSCYYTTLLILWGIFNSKPFRVAPYFTFFYFFTSLQPISAVLTNWGSRNVSLAWGHLILLYLLSINLFNNQLHLNATHVFSIYHQSWSRLGWTVPSVRSWGLEDFWKEQSVSWKTWDVVSSLQMITTVHTHPDVNAFLFSQTTANFLTLYFTQGLFVSLHKYFYHSLFTIFYEVLIAFTLWMYYYKQRATLTY